MRFGSVWVDATAFRKGAMGDIGLPGTAAIDGIDGTDGIDGVDGAARWRSVRIDRNIYCYDSELETMTFGLTWALIGL